MTFIQICQLMLLCIFFLLCFTKFAKWHSRKNCTEQVDAFVVEVLSRQPSKGTRLLYKPIYKIGCGGTEMVIESA